MAFIGSPEIVAAYAMAGRLSFNPLEDPVEGPNGEFKLEAPGAAPDLPPEGFLRDVAGFVAPPDDGSHVEISVSGDSKRLQLLAPFDAWDGKDFLKLPLLLKARGKCTTDHISPAGPWLRFRGHLDNISDNMFTGATNAFTGKPGVTDNQLDGGDDLPVPQVARAYKAEGLRWVVVGDENYGEGSSREHAAMSPRLLGAAAVIVRSFARIHESNLKKQGVLPLTFVDPADYEKVAQGDRISVIGLAALAPGKPVEVVLDHQDGSRDTIETRHSLNAEQIDWFQAGSALNVLKRQGN
jgi:aconitate hydratase